MKILTKYCRYVLTIPIIMLMVTGCGDDVDDGQNPEIPEGEITFISETKEIIFTNDGVSVQNLSFNSNLSWAISDIDESWVVVTPTAGDAGDATLKVRLLEEPGELQRNISITITAGSAQEVFSIRQDAKPGPPEDKDVEGVSIIRLQKRIILTQVMPLELELTPEDAVAREISWSSSNPAIVEVDDSGVVTAIELGEAEITVTVDGFTNRCTIEVVEGFTTDGEGKTYTFEDLRALEYSGVTKEGSTYVMGGSIIVAENDILELRNLEYVKMKDDVAITVNGFLDFTPEDMAVVARYDDTTVPLYIYFTGDNSGGEIRNVTLVNVPIRCFGRLDITIDRCIFRDITSNYAAVNLGGARQTTVTNCSFIENSYPAVQGGANVESPLIFKNNWVYKNSKTARNRPQVNITPAGNGKVEIVANEIVGPREITTNGGIAVANLLGIPGTNEVLIEGNKVRDCRYGITTNGVMDVRIIDNELIDNKYESKAMNGGSGISIYNNGGGQKAYIRGNLISGHLWGITNIGSVSTGKGAAVNLGNATAGADNNPGGNTFVSNGNGGQLYDLYNNSPLDMFAQGNKWNVTTQDEASIETVIYHKPDLASLGIVTFMPAGN